MNISYFHYIRKNEECKKKLLACIQFVFLTM